MDRDSCNSLDPNIMYIAYYINNYINTHITGWLAYHEHVSFRFSGRIVKNSRVTRIIVH